MLESCPCSYCPSLRQPSSNSASRSTLWASIWDSMLQRSNHSMCSLALAALNPEFQVKLEVFSAYWTRLEHKLVPVYWKSGWSNRLRTCKKSCYVMRSLSSSSAMSTSVMTSRVFTCGLSQIWRNCTRNFTVFRPRCATMLNWLIVSRSTIWLLRLKIWLTIWRRMSSSRSTRSRQKWSILLRAR